MDLLDHLRRDGIPVGRIVPALDGMASVLYGGRVFQLQSYIDGRSFQPYEAPDWVSRILPVTLGEIARSLRDYTELPEEHLSWYRRDLNARAHVFEGFAGNADAAYWLSADQRRRLMDSARRRLPIVWEVIRSFTYLDTSCRKGGIDPSALRRYVSRFEEIFPLSNDDKRYMIDALCD